MEIPKPRSGSKLTVSITPEKLITGKAPKGSTLEFQALSDVGYYRPGDVERVQVKEGSFSFAPQSATPGDTFRFRVKTEGEVSAWQVVHYAPPGGVDNHNSAVIRDLIKLTPSGPGKLKVTNAFQDEGRQVTEPGAKLQLTNTRTGEKTVVDMTPATRGSSRGGSFPAHVEVNGQPGDVFSIAVTDGTNNADFSAAATQITAGQQKWGPPSLDVPSLFVLPGAMTLADLKVTNYTGPVFDPTLSIGDSIQGVLGDCYAVSGEGTAVADALRAAAIQSVARHPGFIDQLKQRIVQVDPRNKAQLAELSGKMTRQDRQELDRLVQGAAPGVRVFTVQLKEVDPVTELVRDRYIPVTSELYQVGNGPNVPPTLRGLPLMGRGTNPSDPTQMELCFPLVEKAFAKLISPKDLASYELTSNSWSTLFWEALFGTKGVRMPIGNLSTDEVWSILEHDSRLAMPLVISTFDSTHYPPVAGLLAPVPHWLPSHAYELLGTRVAKAPDGTVTRLVQIRNPWGKLVPVALPPGRVDNGIFELPVEELVKNIYGLNRSLYSLSRGRAISPTEPLAVSAQQSQLPA